MTAKTQALTKLEQEYLAAVSGNGVEVEQGDANPPELKLATANNALCSEDSPLFDSRIKPGTFYAAPMIEPIGKNVVVAILRFFGTKRVEFGRNGSSWFVVDPDVPAGDKRCRGRVAVDEKTGEETWVKPAATEFMHYAVVIPDKPELGVLLWTVQGGTIKQCRELNGILRSPLVIKGTRVMNPAPYARQIRLSVSSNYDSKTKKTYHDILVSPAGQTEPTVAVACHSCLDEADELKRIARQLARPEQEAPASE